MFAADAVGGAGVLFASSTTQPEMEYFRQIGSFSEWMFGGFKRRFQTVTSSLFSKT